MHSYTSYERLGVYIMANAKKLPSGNWRIRVFCGKNENGKQIFKSFTADTRWKAEKMADDYLKHGKRKNRKLLLVKQLTVISGLKKMCLPPVLSGDMAL